MTSDVPAWTWRHAGAPKAQAGARQCERIASPKEGSLMNIRLRRLARRIGHDLRVHRPGMMAFLSASMLAIDVGMLMTARYQAQNSADAGALGGARRSIFDNYDDRSASGPAVTTAIDAARGNKVMEGDVSVNAADVEFLNDPSGEPNRVRVTVRRTAARGNPVSTLIAQVLRDGDRRHRRHRHRRSLAGQRDDLREAVHDSRTSGSRGRRRRGTRRQLRRVRQQGQARSPIPDIYIGADRPGYTGYNGRAREGPR